MQLTYVLYYFLPPEVPPSPLSVHDRYSSPAAGSAKRRLFGDDPPGQTSGLSPILSPAKRLTFGSSSTLKIGGQSAQTTVLSVPLQGRWHVFITVWINKHTNVLVKTHWHHPGHYQASGIILVTLVSAGVSNDRTITLIPVQSYDGSGAVSAQFLLTASPSRPAPAASTTSDAQTGNGRPRRTGSLALFFRKVRGGSRSDTQTCQVCVETLRHSGTVQGLGNLCFGSSSPTLVFCHVSQGPKDVTLDTD